MTTPAGRLSCDEGGCKNTFQTQTGLDKHMKNKHEHLLPGPSNQAVVHVTPASVQAAKEVIPDDGEDQDLLDELQKVENELQDNEDEHDELIEIVKRLRVVLKKKTDIQRVFKMSHEEEMEKRDEVEEDMKKEIEKHQKDIKALRDRNISILKESKKKKQVNKELDKEKSELQNEITVLRVKNGILAKDISDFKIQLDNKSKYVKQLEEQNAPDNDEEAEIAIVVEKSATIMSKKSQEHNCNACERTFANNKDLDNHMEAKHSQQICNFCEEVFINISDLRRHTDQCVEYNKTTIKCKKCQKTFTRFGIKAHGNMCHGKMTNDIYACSECEFKARSAINVKNHQAKEHTEIVYACDECGHKEKSARDISNHQATKHRDAETEVSKEVCKHWRNGNCWKGNKCLYSHVGFQKSNSSKTTSKTNTSGWSPACRHGEGCSWLAKGDCRFFHKGVGVQKPAQSKQQTQSKEDRMCHFNDKCTNNMCRFKHSLAEGFQSQRRQQGQTIRVVKHGRFSQ